MDTMGMTVEVWPVAADRPQETGPAGLWLLSGSEPLVDPVPCAGDCGPEETMRNLLDVGGCAAAVITHSTSWRAVRTGVRITYVAVCALAPGELVLDRWPGARPITLDVAERVGRPAMHDANQPPDEVRDIDVLNHALRHLRWLDGDDGDAAVQAAMPADVRLALADLRPALAGMYMGALPDNVRQLTDRRRAA